LQQINGVDKTIDLPQVTLNAKALEDIDLLILPIKHYQVEAALLSLQGQLAKHTTILLLHNGMGTKALIEKHLPDSPYLIGITTDAAYQVSANRFHQVACGKLEIGEPLQASEVASRNISKRSLSDLMKLHPQMVWREDIEFAQYQKLAINAAINPLSATKNCKNGEVRQYQDELKNIKSEIFDLYEFMNLPIDNHELSKQIDDVIDLTKNNYSSMHQDFHKNRQTEIEGILGYLLLKGEETGMKLPFIESLYKEIISQPST
jgi:2-dehydropantoate 2-reductase